MWTPCGLAHLRFLLFSLWPRRRRSTEDAILDITYLFLILSSHRRQVLSRVTAEFWLELLHTKRSKESSRTGRSTEVLLRRTLAGCRPVKVKLLWGRHLQSHWLYATRFL